MGAKPKSQTVGFRYYFDIHFALGKKVDEICEIRASGKTAWKGSITNNGQIRINAPKLFGGDKGEGGLDGTLDVMFGDESQAVVPKLASMLGGIVPAFRGITSGFYSGMISAINPYPKTWEILRRGGNRLWGSDGAWYPERQFVWLADNQIKAMNPAHILYLVYTGNEFRGLPRARMDEAAWRKAADTLYAEQLGLCFEWKRSDSFKSFCETVKAHIGAEIYPDRMTGLLSIRLIRDDYDPASLPLFDEDSGLLEIIQEQATSSASAPSQLVVKFIDQVRGDQRQVVIANNAVAAATGRRSTETVEYFGAPTAQIAGRMGARDMRVKASGLKRFKIVLDRRGRWLTPGAPLRIRSVRRGIGEIVVRAGRIEDNFLGDGKVTVTVLQDQFGLPASSSVAVPPPGWVPPDRTPRAITTRRLFEAPYRELAGIIDPANLKLLDPTAAYLIAVAEAPTSLSQSFNLTDRVGGSGTFVDRGAGDWCPSGLLVADLSPSAMASMVALSNTTRLDEVRVGQAALLDDEIVRVDAVDYTNAKLTLARGCADTVPASHSAGARIWFYDGFECVDDVVYTQGVSLQAQLLSNTSEGQLAPAMAATDTLALVGRQGRPYPPGQLKVNGAYYPDTIDGALSLSWAHRDRLMQADQLIDSSVGSIGPESGSTVSINLYGEQGTLIKSLTGLTSTSWSWTANEEITASGLGFDVDLSAFASAILADAPMAFYKLDSGVTGGVATDSSVNVRHGTWTAGAAGGERFMGVVGGRFAPGAQRVNLPGMTIDGATGFSAFALWNPSGVKSWERVFDLGNGTANNNILLGRNATTAQIAFGFWNGTAQGPQVTGGVITPGQWHLVGITVNAEKQAKLWCNGQLVGEATFAMLPNAVVRNTNYIGYSPWGEQADARIAGLALFNAAVLDERVAAYWSTVKDQLNKGRLNSRLRVEAWVVRNGSASAQRHDITVKRR